MYSLIFTEAFEKSYSKIDNKQIQKQIWSKCQELELRAPLGKKLKSNPYWSIHINKYRVIYQMKGTQIVIVDILQRKYDYREF